MPEKRTTQRARKDAKQGKSPSTQAGEYVHEEIDHVRDGKHGVRSAKQAIAIGLSKARKAGVKVPRPPAGSSSARKSKGAERRRKSNPTPSPKRSRAALSALKREGHSSASSAALSRQAKRASRKRSSASQSASARKAARTRSHEKPT